MRKHVATTLGFLIAPLFAAIALVATGAAKSGYYHIDMSALVGAAIFYCYTLGTTLTKRPRITAESNMRYGPRRSPRRWP